MVSLVIAVIITAVLFDFINGFHDAANAIATVVSTGVLPIRTAVIIAGAFNFFGALLGTAVAKTIAKGFADPAIVTQSVVLSALAGATIWNLITWWRGIPSSSSHALIGGLAGAWSRTPASVPSSGAPWSRKCSSRSWHRRCSASSPHAS